MFTDDYFPPADADAPAETGGRPLPTFYRVLTGDPDEDVTIALALLL